MNNNNNNSDFNNNSNNINNGIKNINGNEAKKDTNDDLITKQFTFKEKDFMDMEKELNQDFMFKQTSDSFEDYSKFLENPQIADMMNNYYYNMPSYGLGMNNMMAPQHF